MATTIEPEVYSALQKFTSCDVTDALIKLGVPYGGLLYGLSMWSPARQVGDHKVFGPAYTVQMVDAADTSAPKPTSHFVDGVGKNCVVFISQPAGHYCSSWGGLMSTRAQYLGAQGVVIDGHFRDINEHLELGFPLFAKEISTPGSAGFTRAAGINVPIKFTSTLQSAPAIIINPGDVILGDADGVVVIPPKHAAQALKLCEERFAIDQETLACIKRGEKFGDIINRLRNPADR